MQKERISVSAVFIMKMEAVTFGYRYFYFSSCLVLAHSAKIIK